MICKIETINNILSSWDPLALVNRSVEMNIRNMFLLFSVSVDYKSV